jgi:hypothetical protein
MSVMAYPVVEAKRRLSDLLKQAIREGEVRIIGEDGAVFVVKPDPAGRSPFDIEGLDLGVTTSDIIESIRESRARQ